MFHTSRYFDVVDENGNVQTVNLPATTSAHSITVDPLSRYTSSRLSMRIRFAAEGAAIWKWRSAVSIARTSFGASITPRYRRNPPCICWNTRQVIGFFFLRVFVKSSGRILGVKVEESCAFHSDFGLLPALRFGIRDGWQDEQNEVGDCGMRIGSLVFDRNRRCAAFSVIR
jgi:hypothetical protein